MGSVPISLFKGDGSFLIVQDFSKHLLAVRLQVYTTSVWVHSIGYPVFCTCSAKAEVVMFSSLSAFCVFVLRSFLSVLYYRFGGNYHMGYSKL